MGFLKGIIRMSWCYHAYILMDPTERKEKEEKGKTRG